MKKIARLCLKIIYELLLCFLIYKLVFAVAKNKDKSINKYKDYYKLMCVWANLSNDKIVDYLQKKYIASVAIYGGRDMGEIMYKQLENSPINVKFFIDKSSYSNSFSKLPLYSPDDKIDDADAVIVTPYMEYENIKNVLNKKNNLNVISIKDVIYGASKL